MSSVVGIILGAGYGTRLRRGIEADETQRYAHLKELPKPLVPIKSGNTILDIWVAKLKESEQVKDIYVVSNDHFYSKYETWAKDKDFPVDRIINDGTTTNETRLGAVADINLVIKESKKENQNDGVLVIAGDLLFPSSFSIAEFLRQLPEGHNGTVYYNVTDDAEVSKRGIIEIADQHSNGGVITNFLEKPQPEETKSRKACPAFYYFTPDAKPYFDKFLDLFGEKPLEERDAPGKFFSWLVKEQKVYGVQVAKRYDVGSLDDYIFTVNTYN